MQVEPYADIHHFDGSDKSTIDDDGDPRLGWYFQFMKTITEPLTSLFGPYESSRECEAAAIKEWVLH
jgi:hypothetical protein